MKKFLIPAIFLFFLASAYGGTSVSTIIQTIVPETLAVNSDMATTMTVDVFNSSKAILGYINIFSNRTGKWTITISSMNAGSMKGAAAGNSDAYPYTLKFGTQSNISLATPFSIEMSGKTAAEGTALPLGVDFQNFWDMGSPVSPDIYRDTITITIAAA